MHKVTKTALKVLFLLCLAVLIFIYARPIFTSITGWTLKTYSQLQWNKQLHFEQLYFENGKITILEPQLDDGSKFKAKKITLSVGIELLKLKIPLHIFLENPEWNYEQLFNIPSEKNPLFYAANEKLFKIESFLKIDNGQILWTSQDDSRKKIIFNVDLSKKNGGHAQFFFHFDANESFPLFFQIYRKKNEFNANCSFENLNTKTCIEFAQFLKLVNVTHEIKSGLMTGQLSGKFHKSKSYSLEGKIQVDDLHYFNPLLSLDIAIPSAEILFARNLQSQQSMNEIVFVEPAKISLNEFSVVFDQIQGKLFNTEKYLLQLDLKTEIQYKNEWTKPYLLNGKILFNKKKEGELLLYSEHHPKEKILFSFFDTEIENLKRVNIEIEEIKNLCDIFFKKYTPFYERLLISTTIYNQGKHFEVKGEMNLFDKVNNPIFPQKVLFGFNANKKLNSPNKPFISKGWFHSQFFDLKHFLPETELFNQSLKLHGQTKLYGQFDSNFLKMELTARNFKIENEFFMFEFSNEHSSKKNPPFGNLEWNRQTGDFRGSFPIHQGFFIDKEHHFQLRSIESVLDIENSVFSLESFECYCEEAFFSGKMILDYLPFNPQSSILKIECPHFSGKMQHLYPFVNFFEESSFFKKYPCDGQLVAREDGIQLKVNCFSNNCLLEGSVKGSLIEGSFDFKKNSFLLKGIYTDIYFEPQSEKLEFFNFQGTLLTGKPSDNQEYTILSRYIHFLELNKPLFVMDLFIKDKEQEVFHFTGHSEKTKDGYAIFIEPNFTHFMKIYPTHWKCELDSNCDIRIFECETTFDISLLQRKILENYPVYSSFSKKAIFYGETQLKIFYDPRRENYYYQLESDQIKRENQESHQLLITGNFKDNKCTIDPLKWDDWECYGEVEKKPQSWKIPSLIFKIKDLVQGSLKTEIFPKQSIVHTDIRLCKFNLQYLLASLDFYPFLKELKIEGQGTLKGRINWNYSKVKNINPSEGELCLDIENFKANDIPLILKHPLQLKLTQNNDFLIHNLFLESSHQSYINLRLLRYDFDDQSAICPVFRMNLSNDDFKKISSSFSNEFMIKNLMENMNHICKTQKKKSLNLSGNFQCFPQKSLLKIHLDKGKYTFSNHVVYLNQIDCILHHRKLKCFVMGEYENHPFQGKISSTWPIEQGQLSLIDLHPSFKSSLQPFLKIKWTFPSLKKLILSSVRGNFGEWSFDLSRSFRHPIHSTILEGKIDFNLTEKFPFCSSEQEAWMKKVNFRSRGTFFGVLDYVSLLDLEKTLFIKGNFYSNFFAFNNDLLKDIRGNFNIVRRNCVVQDLKVKDPKGTLKVPFIRIFHHFYEQAWSFQIPSVFFKNFKPQKIQFIQDYFFISSKFDDLIIKHLKIFDFSGQKFHLTTWKCSGSFHFLNARKNRFYSEFFDIPKEITEKLNLDGQNLNPMTGKIYFDLIDNYIYLNRFKNVYTVGRNAKFNLSSDQSRSWLNLEGYLNIHLKMKHVNPIYRFANSFAVSIKGPIQKPEYVLEKISKKSQAKTSKN